MRNGAVTGWLLLLPAAALLVLFTHWPIVGSVWDSFYSTPKGSRPPVFIGLDNYQAMVADEVFWKSLWNNLWFALGTIPISIALALAPSTPTELPALMRNPFAYTFVSGAVSPAASSTEPPATIATEPQPEADDCCAIVLAPLSDVVRASTTPRVTSLDDPVVPRRMFPPSVASAVPAVIVSVDPEDRSIDPRTVVAPSTREPVDTSPAAL